METIKDRGTSLLNYLVDMGTNLLAFTWGFVLAISIIVAFSWVGTRAKRWVHRKYLHRVERNQAASALIDNLFRVFVIILGVVVALGVVGVPTSSLVTWIGVIVAALSLSLQSVIQNLVSGFYLLIEQPFTVGDRITVQGQTGTVQRVAIRVTVMRNLRQEMVMVPNFIVFTEAVQAKLGLAPECLVINVSPIDLPIEEVVRELQMVLRGVIGNAEPNPIFNFDAMRPTGASVTIRMWLEDIGRQRNQVVTALHNRFPGASVMVVEDFWPRQFM
ncbi:MAG TPA: mechanosensitive ion channel family protein, partial [Thermomicrobiales bacterium]|nr:mechanosensitive ion channel family protein [Thermomicrobiales bacterium]